MNQIGVNNNKMIKRIRTIVVLMGGIVFAILFYVSCYMMFPHGSKALFFCFFGFGGIFLPLVPVFVYDKYKSHILCLIACFILFIPIILLIVYLLKMKTIANHNYVLPETEVIKFSTKVNWELVENKYVGNEWKKQIKVESDLGGLDRTGSYYLASLDSDIIISVSVTEDDSYDDDEERGYDLDFDEQAYNQVIFPASMSLGKKQIAAVGITTEALNHNYSSDDGDYGKAKWKCTITIERIFEFWEVLRTDLDYSDIDFNTKYKLGEIGAQDKGNDYIRFEDGSAQYIPYDYDDYIYYTYKDVPLSSVMSTAISEVGYSEEYDYLLIQFKESESLYVYIDVPEKVYYDLCSSESPGRYFNYYIRDHYDYIWLE